MMKNRAICHDDQRRSQVRTKPELNGLDYLEVGDDQRSLTVYFLGKAPQQLQKGSIQYVRIEGGRRIRDLKIQDIDVERVDDPEMDDWMTVYLDRYGDFSTYTLRLVGIDNIDPLYDHLEFSFKVGCPSELDCVRSAACPPAPLAEPEINYLAKDYASFRQLILDRLALIMPNWQERHIPDIGIALTEILAYVGDHLSYYQDAVATEAYLDTARQRVSVRRHARLMDYFLHEGCNARAWVCIAVDDDLTLEPRDTFFITGMNNALGVGQVALRAADLRDLTDRTYEVFEPIGDDPIRLYQAHNELHFYTWGERSCCLPRGATSATLRYEWKLPQPAPSEVYEEVSQKQLPSRQRPVKPPRQPATRLQLRPGDLLIFEEVLGPHTGNPADADPQRRHVVRLTRVQPDLDTLYDPPVQIVEIEWAASDALPFPLCISAISDATDCRYREGISVARGNVVLIDHGWTIDPLEELGKVPRAESQQICGCEGQPVDVTIVAGQFSPVLRKQPLTHSQQLQHGSPASRMLTQKTYLAFPQIELVSLPPNADGSEALFAWSDLADPDNLIERLRTSSDAQTKYLLGHLSIDTRHLLSKQSPTPAEEARLRRVFLADLLQLTERWYPRRDLIGSRHDAERFVVEIENDGRARLRFGNGELGRIPAAGSAFFARYRIGNGSRGNVGAESISHIVFRAHWQNGIAGVRNPLPAQGGTDPEPIAEAKLYAPTNHRRQLRRAITPEDYAQLVQEKFKDSVQRAAATLVWTGSWYEVLVVVDPVGRQHADPELLNRITSMLYRYRRIGYDVTVRLAEYVPLDIELLVCVQSHQLRGHVRAALLDAFSNRVLANGQRGFFHPDNLSFGDGIAMSRLVAHAQMIEGVASAWVTRLQRQFDPTNQDYLISGILPIEPLEIARLDNDPNEPEHGKLVLHVRGGK